MRCPYQDGMPVEKVKLAEAASYTSHLFIEGEGVKVVVA